MFSSIVPVPMMRVFYQALGARMGPNTYSGGVLFDPPFLVLGANTIVGQRALVIPHVIEGDRLEHHLIRIGDNVTIGAHAIVMSDVEIADGAIVSAAAVVSKGDPDRAWRGMGRGAGPAVEVAIPGRIAEFSYSRPTGGGEQARRTAWTWAVAPRPVSLGRRARGMCRAKATELPRKGTRPGRDRRAALRFAAAAPSQCRGILQLLVRRRSGSASFADFSCYIR